VTPSQEVKRIEIQIRDAIDRLSEVVEGACDTWELYGYSPTAEAYRKRNSRHRRGCIQELNDTLQAHANGNLSEPVLMDILGKQFKILSRRLSL
jgi:hypothetical protein